MYLPKGYKPSKKVAIASYIILGIAFMYFVYLNTKRYIAFSGEVRYTICTITDRYLTSSGRDIRYSYKVNNVTYRSTAGYTYESKVGGKYWIKYSVKYPNISDIYQNMPVPACIDTLPPNGFAGRYNCEQFLRWKKWARKQKNSK